MSDDRTHDDRESGDAESAGYPRKRAQTRRRLLRAGMEVVADRGVNGATVGAIAKAAGVAPGTFYNHFPTLPDLLDAITLLLGGGVEIGNETLALIENDPALRVAIGGLQLLEMAEQNPTSAAAFVTLLSSKPDFRARIRQVVGAAIEAGAVTGRFDTTPGPAVTNAVLGTAAQSMRSRLLGETDSSNSPEAVALMLRLLGTPVDEIDDIVDQAMRAVREPATTG